jgi:hypothetical protein
MSDKRKNWNVKERGGFFLGGKSMAVLVVKAEDSAERSLLV